MNARALLIEVRWPDGRFHGVRESRESGRRTDNVVPEWPPSPFRLFQALVAGAYGGRWAAEGRAEKDAAFVWLERLDPPAISAPPPQTLRPVTYFVPNNDLDAKGGDPDRIAETRTSKTLRTTSFDADRPVAYLWTFDGEDTPAHRIAELTSRLHTLGHGIDAAFADAEVLEAAVAEERLMALGGAPRRPARGRAVSIGTPCPALGSLESLRQRHEAFTGRFERVGSGRKAVTEFRQPSKAHARAVVYDRTATRRLYELKPIEDDKRFRSWPLVGASALVVAVREQIERALGPGWPDEVAQLVVGRGASAADIPLRLRIVPLPSIGMRHTDADIRRVLVEAPPDFPIPFSDLDWSLAGRELADSEGALCGIVLTPTNDTSMLVRYGINHGQAASRRWQTVTPAVLPSLMGRDGRSRAAAEAGAAAAIAQALRHAGVTPPVTDIRVQREPFDLKGERSDRFSSDRFDGATCGMSN
jgi:CRISPR-associated protein Csb2